MHVDDLAAYAEEAAQRGVPGCARLRSLVAVRGDDEAVSETDLESGFVRLMRKGRLPIEQRQVPREGVRNGRIDFFYPDQNLVIEVDGRKWHSGRRELKRDKRYDNELNISGKRVLRLTWEDVFVEEEYTLEIVARALGIKALF